MSPIPTLAAPRVRARRGGLALAHRDRHPHAPIHRRHPFTARHFARWLDLFAATVDDHFAGPTAEAAKQRAAKMAAALRRLLDGRPGPAPGRHPASIDLMRRR